jgi:hypothetical protein
MRHVYKCQSPCLSFPGTMSPRSSNDRLGLELLLLLILGPGCAFFSKDAAAWLGLRRRRAQSRTNGHASWESELREMDLNVEARVIVWWPSCQKIVVSTGGRPRLGYKES